MGIMDNDEAERRLIEALKFVMVALRDQDHPTSGFLTDTSVMMLLVEMKRRGVKIDVARP